MRNMKDNRLVKDLYSSAVEGREKKVAVKELFRARDGSAEDVSGMI